MKTVGRNTSRGLLRLEHLCWPCVTGILLFYFWGHLFRRRVNQSWRVDQSAGGNQADWTAGSTDGLPAARSISRRPINPIIISTTKKPIQVLMKFWFKKKRTIEIFGGLNHGSESWRSSRNRGCCGFIGNAVRARGEKRRSFERAAINS